MKKGIEKIFTDEKKEVDAILKNIDHHPEMFQEEAKYFFLGQKAQLLIIEKKLTKELSQNTINSCICNPEEYTDYTTVKCCNQCGLPVEEFWFKVSFNPTMKRRVIKQK